MFVFPEQNVRILIFVWPGTMEINIFRRGCFKMLGRFNHQEVDGWGSPQRVKSVNTDELSVTQLKKKNYIFSSGILIFMKSIINSHIFTKRNNGGCKWVLSEVGSRRCHCSSASVVWLLQKEREQLSVLLYCLIIQPFAVSRLPPERTSSWSRRVEQRRM